MANSLCFASVCSLKSPSRPGTLSPLWLILEDSVAGSGRFLRVNKYFQNSGTPKFLSLEVKATDSNQSTKPNSIVCADCDGNGAVLCSQCKGSGVNSVDHFNGQFKAGGLCWLCR
uniref:Putative chaperon P13.9 n=1 Tax=Rhizophora mucronata TaxID=61149 RepID=A0A2P2LBR4_RHIMU